MQTICIIDAGAGQKTRELRREIMQSMISVHREARYCERSEQ